MHKILKEEKSQLRIMYLLKVSFKKLDLFKKRTSGNE